MYCNLEFRITTTDYNKPKSPMQQKSRLIFIEMSIDAPFRWWHQRVECHIFCRWDWAAVRGLVANTIEECKHTEGRKRPINASSLGLINYLKKETEVWGHQRNLIRTRFITQSLYHRSLPLTILSFLSLFFFSNLPFSIYWLECVMWKCEWPLNML